MNRFEYVKAGLENDESFVCSERGVKLYNGNEKTSFEDGEVVLTTHRLFWGKPGDISRGETSLCLQLKLITYLDEEITSSNFFGKKKRLIIHLKMPENNQSSRPIENNTKEFIKISGKNGLNNSFLQSFREVVEARIWDVTSDRQNPSNNKTPTIKLRTGIVGIERSIEEKNRATDESITIAFQDLNVLMAMAKDMVNVSKAISMKIRDKKGEISEDETIRFKSYLMSLGINDPVTRDSFATNQEYYKNLSKEVCEMILDTIEESGGMMSLADVYCRINRARGLELISPDDLLNACKCLDGPIKLRKFSSGAMVLQMESEDDEIIAQQIADHVEKATSLSVEELAKLLSIPLLLSRERLLIAEKYGKICRDESIEGLQFFPNLFFKL